MSGTYDDAREVIAQTFSQAGSWRCVSVERTGMSHVESVTPTALASIACDALASAGLTVIRSGCAWECEGCGETFDTDEMQQVQPDGHLACPLCDPADPAVECVQSGCAHADGFDAHGKRTLVPNSTPSGES